MRDSLATAVLALALLLRALVPAAEALPGPDGEPLVICSALGGGLPAGPEEEPTRTRPRPPWDCLACQGLAFGQAVLPQLTLLPLASGLARSPAFPPPPAEVAFGQAVTSVQARAPPAPLSPS
ncbi:hypothetical protein [Tistlia consotensis]|uniref:hypothetical protein n=1 Tax=Tistlia consotensis TaxID=1321365 RepID=UPI000A167E1D|nr:hypothetical protein [Tistlia consotensis]